MKLDIVGWFSSGAILNLCDFLGGFLLDRNGRGGGLFFVHAHVGKSRPMVDQQQSCRVSERVFNTRGVDGNNKKQIEDESM